MKSVRDIKIDMTKFPKEILDTLHASSHKAYIVGGCVRDSILGKMPSDYDITTSADPFTVKKLFKRTIDTGLKHGTVTVLFYENDKPYTYEVTTFRKDGDYEDMRHPKNVEFVSDLSEDLLRRDFTVNAMAYNEEEGLIDIFGGLYDLDKKLIRAVGNPVDRFTEDALRLLRAIRFAAKLGFSIEEETLSAIPLLSKNLSAVSKERVQVELTKTITSKNPDFVKMIFEYGLAPYICDGFENIIVGKFEKDLAPYMAYACLFYNTEQSIVGKILKSLKMDNNNIDKILSLISSKKYLSKFDELYKKENYQDFDLLIKELITEIGYDLTYDFIRLVRINKHYKFLEYIEQKVKKFETDKDPIFIYNLDINGNDLMLLGLKGQEIGMALYYLLRIVHKNKAYNEKKLLQEIVKKAYNMVIKKKEA